MLMGPNDSDLLVSTYMNDISVISFESSDKFNNETKIYEKFFKIKRNSSISGAKSQLLYYCLSNDEKFFAVSCDDQKIKIFRNYGSICESKVHSQIDIGFNAQVIALFVEDFENGKLNGYVAASKGSEVFVYNTNGEKIREINQAHEQEVIALTIVKQKIKEGGSDNQENDLDKMMEKIEGNNKGEVVIISAANDGQIKFWKINE